MVEEGWEGGRDLGEEEGMERVGRVASYLESKNIINSFTIIY